MTELLSPLERLFILTKRIENLRNGKGEYDEIERYRAVMDAYEQREFARMQMP